jgi:hypothetical protein
MTSYLHADYARSLSKFGEPLALHGVAAGW